MQAYNWFLPSGRTRNNLTLPPASNSLFLKSPFFSGYSYWQALPSGLKTCCSIEQFNKLVLQSFKVVRYSFPQSEAIHTQITLKMKKEYFLTKFCEKRTVYMP